MEPIQKTSQTKKTTKEGGVPIKEHTIAADSVREL
jgi:hypothetical protein